MERYLTGHCSFSIPRSLCSMPFIKNLPLLLPRRSIIFFQKGQVVFWVGPRIYIVWAAESLSIRFALWVELFEEIVFFLVGTDSLKNPIEMRLNYIVANSPLVRHLNLNSFSGKAQWCIRQISGLGFVLRFLGSQLTPQCPPQGGTIML